MFKRLYQEKLLELCNTFKAVAVVGPRQSGKTTLLKQSFKHKSYVSLENLQNRQFAKEDPVGFLNNYPDGAIIDEAQLVPELFSYLQEILDNSSQKGLFILSGSNNFLLQENISQSLAGRIAYLELLPFSYLELTKAKRLPPSTQSLLYKGCYPPIYDQNIPSNDWCVNYVRTYIDRDVRQLKNIGNLTSFERFLRILAGRNGQEVNKQSIAIDAGIDNKTVDAWISVLEASYIVYLLKPHYKNFNKQISKRPKLYFYDTALVCYLLGIQSEQQISTHPLKGSLFESYVITEFLKHRYQQGKRSNLYYWRDKTGREIDLIIDRGTELVPVEIKYTETYKEEHAKNLKYYQKISNCKKTYLLYNGIESQKRSDGLNVLPWKNYLDNFKTKGV